MNAIRSLIAVLLFSLVTVLAASAQTTNCWLIINGPGAGTRVLSIDNIAVDLIQGHSGEIYLGSFSDCLCLGAAGHYHGTLYGEDDPKENGCGWGCVVEVPWNIEGAELELDDLLDEVAFDDPELALKLDDMLAAFKAAISNDCYELAYHSMEAILDEIDAATYTAGLPEDRADDLIDAAMDYGMFCMETLDGGFPTLPTPSEFPYLRVMRRQGSGVNSLVRILRKKIVLQPRRLVFIESEGYPSMGSLRFKFRFSGLAKDAMSAVPPMTYLNIKDTRVGIYAREETSFKLEASYTYGDEKPLRLKYKIQFK